MDSADTPNNSAGALPKRTATAAGGPPASAQRPLLRVLGPVGATAVVVGSVIGSGIFFKANVVVQAVGRFDLAIGVWIVCGAISLMGALALAELGAMMPQAGGPYVYLREAYGPLIAFLWGWTEFWTIRTGSIAALAVAFSHALVRLCGEWIGSMGWSESPWLPRLIAIAAIGLLTAVNYAGARWGGLTQDVTTFFKVGTLLALMILPLVTGAAKVSYLSDAIPRAGGMGMVAGIATAMTAVFWAYDGWGNIGPVAEEIRQPQKNIPRALTLGMLIVIALYLGGTLAYHLMLPIGQIAESPFVAASAWERLVGPRGTAIASGAVMVSTFGALNANLLVGPGVLFAMARDRLFLPSAAAVHPRFRTPHLAIVAIGGWSVVLILGSDLLKLARMPDWLSDAPPWLAQPLGETLRRVSTKAIYDVLTDYVIFGAFTFYLLAVAAVFVLRWRRPEMPRPYKAWGYPVVPLLFVGCSSAFLCGMFFTSPVESLCGLAFIGLGSVVYRLRRYLLARAPAPTADA